MTFELCPQSEKGQILRSIFLKNLLSRLTGTIYMNPE